MSFPSLSLASPLFSSSSVVSLEKRRNNVELFAGGGFVDGGWHAGGRKRQGRDGCSDMIRNCVPHGGWDSRGDQFVEGDDRLAAFSQFDTLLGDY